MGYGAKWQIYGAKIQKKITKPSSINRLLMSVVSHLKFRESNCQGKITKIF
jgi:hypothetical protein